MAQCALAEEIKQSSECIRSCYKRIAVLEDRLALNDFSPSQENTVRRELEECRKLLNTNEDILSHLHGHGFNISRVAMAVGTAISMVWMIYLVVRANNF